MLFLKRDKEIVIEKTQLTLLYTKYGQRILYGRRDKNAPILLLKKNHTNATIG